jgi:uncharacterized protein YbjT (DUF2867 family)
MALRAGAELVESARRARAADSVARGFFLVLTPESVRETNQIWLPFGQGKTSPVAVEDIARVIAALLVNPEPHIGKIYHLTGPQSENMDFYAQGYSRALGRRITYQDIPVEVAGGSASARIVSSPCEPPRDDGRPASRGTL